MDIPAKRQRHPLGHEQRSLTGAPSSPSTRDRGHQTYGARRRLRHPSPGRCRRASCHARWWRLWLRGRRRPPPAGGSSNLRPRRRWGDRAPRAGGPPPSRVRGHREAARHLRQIGLRVAGHVITLRELGLFEAGTSSLCRRLPAAGHFIIADRKTSDFLECITYSQIRAEAEARGREGAHGP